MEILGNIALGFFFYCIFGLVAGIFGTIILDEWDNAPVSEESFMWAFCALWPISLTICVLIGVKTILKHAFGGIATTSREFWSLFVNKVEERVH